MSEAWNLSISPEKVCYLIIKAREFDAKDAVTDPDPASNASDDMMVSVLEDQPDDPVESELESLISDLNEDEQIDLVTLSWLGRGDGKIEDWESIRADAAEAHNDRTTSYLLGTPLLADYLEEAMAQFGESCQEYEMGRL
ncbi:MULTISPECIES: DUF3775 domain-containing protein [unclassified Ensifer]|jgi:hypothetical protein|uniref:DUF3775 domain-containing protein n=1 Tax=unclassified Ensifer TaxID=2633371 RepID=UPI00070952A1|nr:MULTISPECIES: DUF3775 domain-containing protein [unclassified Ensifer]KQW51062.1 hypothetical protein ASD02_32565 [Ensifer sp. Root1252]KRC54312.1 hypothetical protein ASE32_22615 [Ensifer sp. Root231]KRD01646.1 hypothetical protein ASE47_21990 [Ensifer sp. Root258]